jgi:hypothetical protein
MKDLFSKAAFLDWVEKQPADREFDITRTDLCAVGQYAKSLGFSMGSTPDFEIQTGGRPIPIRGLTERIMYGRQGERGVHTFGELARRLREEIAA